MHHRGREGAPRDSGRQRSEHIEILMGMSSSFTGLFRFGMVMMLVRNTDTSFMIMSGCRSRDRRVAVISIFSRIWWFFSVSTLDFLSLVKDELTVCSGWNVDIICTSERLSTCTFCLFFGRGSIDCVCTRPSIVKGGSSNDWFGEDFADITFICRSNFLRRRGCGPSIVVRMLSGFNIAGMGMRMSIWFGAVRVTSMAMIMEQHQTNYIRSESSTSNNKNQNRLRNN